MTAILTFGIAILLFVLVVLFLILPSNRNHPDLKKLNGLLIAHRGLHQNENGIPENSLKAFKAAIENGFAIENDIHITKDGKIVVFHDDSLKRMCGVDKIIEDLTLEEIKKYPLLNSNEYIPTLKECLALIDGKVPLLVEFKCRSLISCTELCEKANEILSDYKGKYFVQSFYPFVIKWYRKNRPDILRGQLAEAFKGEELHKRALGNMLLNFISRPDFISYRHNHKNKFMFRLSKKLGGFPVGWTFTSQEEIDASKSDFKAFIFENFKADLKD